MLLLLLLLLLPPPLLLLPLLPLPRCRGEPLRVRPPVLRRLVCCRSRRGSDTQQAMDPSQLERWSATAMDTSQQERWEREAMGADAPDWLRRWANDRRWERGELPLTFPSVEEAEEERDGVKRRRLTAAVEEERRCRRRAEEERDRAVATAELAEAKAEATVAAWEGERRRAGEAEERAKKAEEKAESCRFVAQLWYGRAQMCRWLWKTADEELQGKLKAQAEEAKAREAAAAAMKEVTRALALVTVTGVTINGD